MGVRGGGLWGVCEPTPPNPTPPPLFGAKVFHCTGHCAGRTFFGKKPSAGHCVVTPITKRGSESIPPISHMSAETCHTRVWGGGGVATPPPPPPGDAELLSNTLGLPFGHAASRPQPSPHPLAMSFTVSVLPVPAGPEGAPPNFRCRAPVMVM